MKKITFFIAAIAMPFFNYLMAQCSFATQQQRYEYAAIKAIYEANPQNTLSNEWKQLANNQICDVCLIPELYCNERGELKGLSIGGKNISKIPREIVGLNELDFFDLQNNQISCLPSQAQVLCNADPFGQVLQGNPISSLTSWSSFCSNPRDLCLSSVPPLACEDVGFISYLDTLIVFGLGNNYNKVEIIGAATNWRVWEICTYCTEFTIIPELPVGDYTIKINLTMPDGGHCYREKQITIYDNYTPSPTPPSSDNMGDGQTNCHNLIFFGGGNQIEVGGLSANRNKVEIIGAPTDWRTEVLCDGNCNEFEMFDQIPAGTYTVKVNQSDRDGNYCYREEKVTVTESNQTPNAPVPIGGDISCDFITFQGFGGQIHIEGLTALYNKVEYIGAGTGWKVKTICDGDCYSDERVFDLPEGSYVVKVNQKGVSGEYCYREELVQVLRSNVSRNSLADGNDFTIAPNPARDYLSVRGLEGTVQINIYNAFGQRVKHIPQYDASSSSTIDLTGFENGMYYLQILNEQHRPATRRFVVEHLR
ncbi:MAG: T9SS type A sorting domain-containing protein [Bacteroidota bacterium]